MIHKDWRCRICGVKLSALKKIGISKKSHMQREHDLKEWRKFRHVFYGEFPERHMI